MMNTAASSSVVTARSNEDGQGARFAVVRLKPGDNLLGLFQLLIHNGFGEVSFVNNLSETIFPAVSGGGKCSASPTPASKTGETTNPSNGHEKSQQLNSNDRGAPEKAKTQPALTNTSFERYKHEPQQQYQIRSSAASDMVHQQQKANGDSLGCVNEDLITKKAAFNFQLQTTSVASTLPAFTSMPSNFLGLPTMSTLNTSVAAAAAIAALSEAVTPPYSLSNFFGSGLQTTAPSATLIQPSSNTGIHQYSPAILAAAAAVQQQRQATAVGPTASTTPTRPRSPAVQNLLNHASAQQQRFPLDQQYKQQFQYTAHQQQRLVNPVQQNKALPQKSPAASPGSSSGSSTYSGHGRISDGSLSSMPPGCATTQLRQRGQRSYAEDPSLYVACRLCKNKIMGSRISNLTNHVRRHSSMKQFQCCYCDYTHNEMAKVRLHMLHNHKDKDSQPIDNLSPEMQASWDLLMKECFPDHCQQQQPTATASPQQHQTMASVHNQRVQGQLQPSASVMAHRRAEITLDEIAFNARNLNRLEPVSNGIISGQQIKVENDLQVLVQVRDRENSSNTSPTSSTSPASGRIGSLSPGAATPPAVDASQLKHLQQCISRCVECGMYVNSKLKPRHIRKCHLQLLSPFVCSMCGYDHAEHSKVKLHICLKHDDSPMAQVVTRDLSTYAEQLVPEYFPENQYSTNDQRQTAEEPASTPANGTIATEELIVDHQAKNDSVIVYGRRDSAAKACQNQEKKCKICRRRIPADRTIQHIQRHMVRAVYYCAICGQYETNYRFRIRRHLKLKHPKLGKDVNSFVMRRRPISTSACSSGGLVKRAARLCFPSASKNIQRRARKFPKAVSQSNRIRRRRKVQKTKRLRDGKVFKSASRLRGIQDTHPTSGRSNKQHQKLTPNGFRPLPPSINTEPGSKAQTEAAMNAISSDLFRICPLCANWIRTDQLAVHLQTHMPPIGPSYRCNMCEYTASDPLVVRAHFMDAHHHQKLQSQSAHQSQHEKQHQAAMLLTYANLCRNNAATAAADG